MGKVKLHDNSDENKRVSPKCGSKTIDLGKKCNRRELMLTPAEGQEVCCSTPFLSLSLCRLLRPPIPHLPSPPKKGVFPEIENIGLLWAKHRNFRGKSTVLLCKEVRCFHFPEGRLSALPSPPFTPEGRGQGRKPEEKREQKRFFSRPQKKQKHG